MLQVLGSAVRLGIRIAEALLRMEAFWKELLAACPGQLAAFKAVCEQTSKGTRACQAICQVAKARKDLAITGKARLLADPLPQQSRRFASDEESSWSAC